MCDWGVCQLRSARLRGGYGRHTPGNDDADGGISATCDAEHCKIPDMVVGGHRDQEASE